jgi:sugar phosphate isomerase/epimerase
MPRDITVSTVAYDGYPLETAINEIAALGMPLVEPAYIKGYMIFDEADFLDPAARHVSGLMQKAGVGAIAISAHMDIGHPESIEMLARRIRFTAAIGARFTITNSTTAERRAALSRTIEANLPLAEELGIVIALENPGHGPGNLMMDGRSGAALIAEFASPHVKMNYDTANALSCTEGAVRPETDIDAALPASAHIHLKDAKRMETEWRYGTLGEGDIDYAILLKKLRAAPDLPLSIELPLRLRRAFHHDPVRAPALTPLETVKSAILASHALVTAGLKG